MVYYLFAEMQSAYSSDPTDKGFWLDEVRVVGHMIIWHQGHGSSP